MSLLLLFGGAAVPVVPSPTGLPTFGFEIAFGHTWIEDDPDMWTDVTPWVFKDSWGIDSGRADELQAFPPSTCGFTLDNADRRFDPSYADGPYFGDLVPTVPVRITATWAGVTYPLFRGYVQGWPFSSSISNRLSEVQVQATDSLDLLGEADYKANVWTLDDPIYGRLDAGNRLGGDGTEWTRTGERVTTILNLVGYPASLQDVDEGVADVFDSVLDGTPREALQSMEQAEDGWLYQGPDGVIHFLDRHSDRSVTRMKESQATFSDADGDRPYLPFLLDSPRAYVYNDVSRTRDGGAPQVVTDQPSIDRYFRSTHDLSDLQNTSDDDTRALAAKFLYLHKDPALRPEPVTIDPGNNRPLLWPEVLGRQLLDRITLVRHPQEIGDPIQTDFRIEGIHLTALGDEWRTSWNLSPVDDTPYWTLDDAVLGLLDAGNLIGA